MTIEKISGRIVTRTGEDRLTIRRSWWPFAGGCVLALASVIAGILWIANALVDPVVYVGGSRARAGTPIHWAQQSWPQRLGVIACMGLPSGMLILLPLAYVIFGSEDQRHPFIFDRAAAGAITRNGIELAKTTDIQAIRVVHAPGGSTGPKGRLPPRTGVFLRLANPPRSIELDCFSRETSAWRFANTLANFLHVPTVDDPIILPNRRPRRDPPGFPVIPPPKSQK